MLVTELWEGNSNPFPRGNPDRHSPEQLDRRSAKLGNLRDQVHQQRTAAVNQAQRLLNVLGLR